MVAFAAREDHGNEVLRGALDRPGGDVHPTERGVNEQAACLKVLPHGQLVFAESCLEFVDAIRPYAQDDDHRFHARTSA